MSKALTDDKVLRKKYWSGLLIVLLCLYSFSASFANYLNKTKNYLFLSKDTLTNVDQKSLIPIHFKLTEAGYVTLVIEDTPGVRVRNLISEAWYPAGNNTIFWDGTNDLGRDQDAANHGIYSVSGNLVMPGHYRIRGLVRKAVTPRYEFSTYSTGSPPWNTADHTGAWLGTHTPPKSALFIPGKLSPDGEDGMLLGCFVTEAADGLIWTNLSGVKKWGVNWVGGVWTAAPFMAADPGKNALANIAAYVGTIWHTAKYSNRLELRINAITADKKVFKISKGVKCLLDISDSSDLNTLIGGLSVYNSEAIVSLKKSNKLILINTVTGKIIDSVMVDSPRGTFATANGELLVISGQRLLKFKPSADTLKFTKPKIVISGLQDPYAVIADKQGYIYITDRGVSNCVKVYDEKGRFVKNIGVPGISVAGPYNPLKMNNPAGLTMDNKQQLWVTEEDYLPKRVSVWSLDGRLINAFYGPAKYGGGGTIDGDDKTRFYYADNTGSMQFKLDWEKASWQLDDILYRPSASDLKLSFRAAAPETPIYLNGRRYFTNCYNSIPTNGPNTAFVFADRNGIAIPVAAMGSAHEWDILKQDEFKVKLPAGVNLKNRDKSDDAFFIWEDNNLNGKVEPDEVVFKKAVTRGITIMPDLSFCITNLDGQAVKFRLSSFTSQGVPQYNMDESEILATGVLSPASSGGVQVLSGSHGYNVITLGINPYSQLSLTGTKNGKPYWSYPDLWPGLHASHQAPVASRPDMLIGTTRLLGGLIDFKDSQIPSIWAINGNHGSVYIFTEDGMLVTTLFKDRGTAPDWMMKSLQRNADIDSLTLAEENFWPTITKTNDEKVYIVDGFRSSIVRIDGLETIRRLPDNFVDVSVKNLQKIKKLNFIKAAHVVQASKDKVLKITLMDHRPVVDGNLDDWNNVPWIQIDNRGFSLKRTGLPVYDVTATLGVFQDRLYGMYCTGGEASPLQNSGELPTALFKTGGALDLMIGTAANANPNRTTPVAGDCRIIIAMVKNKPIAVLYKAVVPGTKATDKVPFSSPSNTITFDRVDDISSKIEFVAKNGSYEFSIPLDAIGLKPVDGLKIKGDMGILRGRDSQTVSRIYWSNKATGITVDVPSEAMLTPSLWGTFVFKKAK